MFPFDDLHIVEDDQVMSSRLGLKSVPTKLVDDCYQNLIIDKKDDIMWLRAVVDEAKNEEGYYCESDDEARMRGYLAGIFNYIASFERAAPRRQWDDSTNEIDEIGPDGVPPTYPKLRLGPRNSQPVASWRDLTSFAVAKPGGMGTPLNYSEALIQSGDYARLHLAGSPFRLFSVGLIINGNDFRVGAFDRAGVMVSSAANMWTDTRTLIRVIRRLSCNLSDTDLGCDPSVCRLPLNSPWYASIRKIATSLRVASDSLDYPSYIVQSPERPLINGDPRHSRVQCEWLTIGPPTWTCLSLFGKGTSIWRVIPVVGDVIDVHAKVYTLKNEWRDSHCVSDSELYEIEGTASAADYHYGGDAVFPYAKSSPAISITNIRNPDYRVKRSNLLDIPSHRSIKPTLMLHRLILKTVGRPLWDADDWVQLLEGFRTALICHEGLWKQGLLHRDINPGNILLTEDGKEGFIADLELVRLRQTEYIRRKATNGGTETTAEVWTNDSARRLQMSGTEQFMAIDRLRAFYHQRPVAEITDHVHHDLESFVWVFAYAVARRLMAQEGLDPVSTQCIHRWFNECFCSWSISDIITYRAAHAPLQLPRSIDTHKDVFPEPFEDLLTVLRERVRYNQPANEYARLVERAELELIIIFRPLTHALLVKPIDSAISELKLLRRQSTED